MIWAIVIVSGLAVGLLIGRWWALVAAPVFGAWVGATTGVDEVPHWYLGFGYGAFAASGIALGIFVRRRLRRVDAAR